MIPENRGVPHVETMGSKMKVDIEKSKAEDRKCEDVGEESDLDERKTMEETKRDDVRNTTTSLCVLMRKLIG